MIFQSKFLSIDHFEHMTSHYLIRIGDSMSYNRK